MSASDSQGGLRCESRQKMEDVMDAVREAVDDGDRDAVGGGIAPKTLESRMEFKAGTIRKHLYRLEDAGRVVRVRGVNPETFHPRESYLPADHPDAPAGSNGVSVE